MIFKKKSNIGRLIQEKKQNDQIAEDGGLSINTGG